MNAPATPKIAAIEPDDLTQLKHKIENLERGLVSARRIGAAIGIVMAVEKLTYEDAFELLCRRSQLTNVKLRDVAEQVLYTGSI